MLPADLLTESAPPARRFENLGRFPLDRPCAYRESIRQAAGLLANARQPLVIAGGGVHLSGAHQALADLLESANLPVATTVMGKVAVAEGHPLFVGVVGYFMGLHGATRHPPPATRHQRELVTEADVILLAGSRTNQNGTDSWKLYPPDARFIHLDADGCEIGRNYEALRLVGDARETLVQLRAELATLASPARSAARPALEARIDLHQAVAELRSDGLQVHPVALDAVDGPAVQEAAAGIEKQFGHLDILVNSAGLNVARRTWADVAPPDWSRVFEVNVNGTYHCIRAVLPGMRQSGGGLIVNIASWAGRITSGKAGPAYNAAKSAVLALTQSLNVEEHRHGIPACALSPGETATSNAGAAGEIAGARRRSLFPGHASSSTQKTRSSQLLKGEMGSE